MNDTYVIVSPKGLEYVGLHTKADDDDLAILPKGSKITLEQQCQ